MWMLIFILLGELLDASIFLGIAFDVPNYG